MEVRLAKLTLRNFQGEKYREFVPGNEITNIFADNGIGKSTIARAFSFLFTGKDTCNNAKFDIKDTTGPIPDGGINHEVEAEMSIDGKKKTFKRVYHEVYSGVRGQNQVLKGHTTDFYIDDEGMAENKWNASLSEYFSEQLFQILTNPFYFNLYLTDKDEKNTWKVRRSLLFKWFGGMTDAEIIASDPSFEELNAILDGKTIESRKSIIDDKIKLLDDEGKKIPDLIDENAKMMPDLTRLNLESLNQEYVAVNKQISEKQAELSRIKNGEELNNKRVAKRGIDVDIKALEDTFNQTIKNDLSQKETEIQRLNLQSQTWSNEITSWNKERSKNSSAISSSQKEVMSLREQWSKEDQKVFVFNPESFLQSDCTCPTCRLKIDTEKMELVKSAFEAQFNLDKAKKLEEITVKGKQFNKDIETLTSVNNELDIKISGNNALIETQNQEIQKIRDEIDLIRQRKLYTVEYKNKLEELSNIVNDISQLEIDSAPAIDVLNKTINTLTISAQAINVDIAKFETADTNKKRIAELGEKQKKIAASIAEYRRQLHIINQFIRHKCEMLTESINSHFSITKWSLFEIRVNGDIVEKCEAEYKGVVNSSANTGATFNMGLDIINAVSKQLNLFLPVFVDGAESVTEPIETIGQQIRLIVSKPDKELRIEYQTKEDK